MDKQIHFVSWKKQRAAQALTQTDSVCDSLISDLIFEAVIDYVREKFGYPGALPIRSITQNEPVLPSPRGAPISCTLDTTDVRRIQKCPVCGEQIDGPRFTAHLEEECFPRAGDRIARLRAYFDAECGSRAAE